jgi:hypothetical protein
MHDLRELLDTAKGDPPPPRFGVDDIVAAGHRRQRRMLIQRIGAGGVVAAAVATVMVLVGSNLVLSRHRGIVDQGTVTQPVAPAVDIPPLTFMFGPYSAGAYRVLPPHEVTLTYQAAYIATDYRDGAGKTATAYIGTLTLYRPGVRPPAVFTTGTKVTVHGQPGFANEREQDLVTVINGSGSYGNPRGIMANTLAWQYAASSWAVIDSVIEIPSDADHRLTAADERALAEKFGLGSPSPARMPFSVGQLPIGWQVVSVSGRNFTSEGIGLVSVIFAPASAATTDKIRHFAGPADGPAVVITLGHRQLVGPPDAPKHKSTCGHLESSTDLWCSWDIPNTLYYVQLHDPAETLTQAELTAIHQGLTFDDPDNPDTWHPVS